MRSLAPKPAYYDVWLRGNRMTLVAFNDRHTELWRRNDPAVRIVVGNLKRWKREVYFHHGR